jgi:hypothetical protein
MRFNNATLKRHAGRVVKPALLTLTISLFALAGLLLNGSGFELMALDKTTVAAQGIIPIVGANSTTTLFTPPLVPQGENVLDCYLVNVSDAQRQATIQIFNRDGLVVQSVETTLNPGHEDVARAAASQLPRYSKFVVQGRREFFRASILIRQEGVGAISALPAE